MQHNRRDFLKLATTTTLGSSALGAAAFKSQEASAATAPFMIVVHCDGGFDQTMVFDNKIGSSIVAQEPGAAVTQAAGGLNYVSNPTRPAVDTFMANHGTKAIIVNGINCKAINHKFGRKHILSAITTRDDSRTSDYMSIYASQVGRTHIFPHVVFDAPYMPGTHGDLSVFLNNRLIAELTAAIPNTTALGTAGEAALSTYLNKNYSSMFARSAYDSLDAKKFWSYYKGYARESALGTAIAAAQASIPVAGTDTDFSRNGKIALQFFKDGLSKCATLRCGGELQWDSHRNNFTQQNTMFETLFDGLTLIVNHAQTLGLYDNLCIVVVSDVGRAPQLNADLGKDHWPYTSCMVWGPHLKTGLTAGLTDTYLRGTRISPVLGVANPYDEILIDTTHVFAALFYKYGLQLKLTLPDVTPLSYILGA